MRAFLATIGFVFFATLAGAIFNRLTGWDVSFSFLIGWFASLVFSHFRKEPA